MKDYSKVNLSIKEQLLFFVQGILLIAVFSCLFYESWNVFFLLSPAVLLYIRTKRTGLIKQQKQKLAYEFKDGLLGISAALNAGYSMENSFSEAINDLKLIYPAEADIVREFVQIDRQLKRNRTVEELLKDFAVRSKVEDIEEFAEVFLTAKRTGGNLLKIMDSTAKNMNDRQEVQREMETLITGKKLEVKIMNMAPLGILCYLKLFSPEFLAPLYHNLQGVMIMSGALAVYVAAAYWSFRIIDISM